MQVNFMALYRLLDFGSGWDPVLKGTCSGVIMTRCRSYHLYIYME
jgi:hypothetical protein